MPLDSGSLASGCVLAALVPVARSALAGSSAVRELLRDPEDTVLLTLEPDPLYEELVSHYVELCAVSQYRPREGGLGGELRGTR